MVRYGVETSKSPKEVIEQAVAFFGEGGLGLEITDQGPCCATFEGSGGYVTVTVTEGAKTNVELVTREWDYDAKRFMRQVA